MEYFNWPGFNFMTKKKTKTKKNTTAANYLSWWRLRALGECLTFCHEVRDTETAFQNTLPQDGERGPIKGQGTTHQHVQNHPHTLQEHTHTQRQLNGEKQDYNVQMYRWHVALLTSPHVVPNLYNFVFCGTQSENLYVKMSPS